jgi:hypothetical protein
MVLTDMPLRCNWQLLPRDVVGSEFELQTRLRSTFYYSTTVCKMEIPQTLFLVPSLPIFFEQPAYGRVRDSNFARQILL